MPLPQPTNWHGWQDSRERRKHGGNKVTFRSCRRPFGSGRTAAKRCRGGNAHGNRLRTGGRCQKSGGSAADLCGKSEKIPAETSAGLDTVGIRMPSHPVARALIQLSGVPIAAPSANISGYPSPTTAQHVMRDMQGKIAAVVDGGACSVGVESTVIALEPNGTVRILRPGFVTKEMLEEVAPEVTLDPAILHQLQEGQTVRSPGMKYQHYSPRAHVILVEGSWQNFAALAEQNRADGVYALVFDGEETMLSLPCLTYGRSGREQAQQIFSKLRELDDDGAQKVYVRAPKPEGIGLAVYNRLIRAAGFEVIQV